jgi:hypothetical protein
MKRLKESDFNISANCIADMNRKYVLIDGLFYYVEIIDSSEVRIKLYDVEKMTIELIGYIYPKNRNSFKIKFRKNGFLFETSVKYNSVKYSKEN